MPITAYGDLRIVGIQDLGPIGPSEGPAVTCSWPLYMNLLRLLPLLTLMALMFAGPNRFRGAWWALVPMLCLPPLLIALCARLGVLREAPFLADNILLLCFSLAFVWLWSYRLIYLSRRSQYLHTLYFLLLSGCIGMVSISGLALAEALLYVGAIHVGLMLLILIALTGAGWACRKTYRPRRFLFWVFVLLVPAMGVLLPLLCWLPGNIFVSFSGRYPTMQQLFFEALFVASIGAASAALVFMMLLPFLLLAMYNRVYRPRFYAIFRFRGMEDDSISASDTDHQEGSKE